MKWFTFTTTRKQILSILPVRIRSTEQAFAVVNKNGSITYIFTGDALTDAITLPFDSKENIVELKETPDLSQLNLIDLYEADLP